MDQFLSMRVQSSKAVFNAYRALQAIALLGAMGYVASLMGGWNPGGIFFAERWKAVTLLGFKTQDSLGVVAATSYLLWLVVGFKTGRLRHLPEVLLALTLGLLVAWFVCMRLSHYVPVRCFRYRLRPVAQQPLCASCPEPAPCRAA